MSRIDRKTEAAVRLMELGVSESGVVDLLSKHAVDEIERQLDWMPYRKAKRPAAFIIDAVRRGYSAPKEAFRAEG